MNQLLQTIFVPLDKDGWVFVAISGAIAFMMSLIHPNLGWIFAAITGWVAYFFRDPPRVTPQGEGLVTSPADGRVCDIVKDTPPAELELPAGDWTRISIFLNVFNVHVNRAPIGGTIIKSHYRPGKFLNASLDKASVDNERQSLAVETKDGVIIPFVQIAGLVARRIRCDTHIGSDIATGERFGMIRFGSRTDVYLPTGIVPRVCVGQLTIAGETILADLKADQTPYQGTTH